MTVITNMVIIMISMMMKTMQGFGSSRLIVMTVINMMMIMIPLVMATMMFIFMTIMMMIMTIALA